MAKVKIRAWVLFGFLVGFSPLPAMAQDSSRAIQVMPGSRPPAPPENRIALVIGNGAYDRAPLRNPPNDARAVSLVLQTCGFQVQTLVDASLAQMEAALRGFGEHLKSGGVGLFYYAGHGMQVDGRNYLIPVAANIAGKDEIRFKALDAGEVLAKMESAGNGLNLMILDACRNDPFGNSWSRGVSAGLAQMDSPTGTYLAFATAPGRTAEDGARENGLYTQQFLEVLKQPGLKVEEVFKRVRVAVKRASNDRQVPWDSSSLTGDFYFVPISADSTPAPAWTAATQVSASLSDRLQNRIGMVFASILAGSFTMGDRNGYLEEMPEHSVRISMPFALQTTPVTLKQWKQFVTATGYVTDIEREGKTWVKHGNLSNSWYRDGGINWRTPGFKQQEDHPVVGVSWEDAQSFLTWLNKEDPGKGYRLPTEAEWEYACKAGTQGPRYGELDRIAWYWTLPRTLPVAQKAPNPWGLYDMLGNVGQWCQDWYSGTYYRTSPALDPQGPQDSSFHVVRGGGWYLGASNVRSGYRNRAAEHYQLNGIGFRLAMDLP